MQIVSASLSEIDRWCPRVDKVVLVTTQGFLARDAYRVLQRLLARRCVQLHLARPNPDCADLSVAVARLRPFRPQAVIGLGGGSVLDSAKVMALLLHEACRLELDEAMDRDLTGVITQRLPLTLIPTTAGTGAEVTPFATVWNHQSSRKHSVASELLIPDVALLDSSLTHSQSPDTLRWAGLDAISHALESLWNHHSDSASRAHAYAALDLAMGALPRLLEGPNPSASFEMQKAATRAGLAISRTRTALAHAISYPLTIRWGVPHGLACSFTLPSILRRNIDAMAQSEAQWCQLKTVETFLKRLNLGKEVGTYVPLQQLQAVSHEMLTPQRAGNYWGAELPDMSHLLAESVGVA